MPINTGKLATDVYFSKLASVTHGIRYFYSTKFEDILLLMLHLYCSFGYFPKDIQVHMLVIYYSQYYYFP